jgi:hypothetical protein
MKVSAFGLVATWLHKFSKDIGWGGEILWFGQLWPIMVVIQMVWAAPMWLWGGSQRPSMQLMGQVRTS